MRVIISRAAPLLFENPPLTPTHPHTPTPQHQNSRFQPVHVPEPTIDETYEILQGLRERYEAHHKLRYTDEALMAAAKYSSQYISDRFLPDKAIDLIDEAGSRVRLRHIQLPEEARELDKELKAVTKDKDAAVRGQDFEKAGTLRDREMELKAKISAVIAGAKEASKAEAESAEAGGPMVVEQDIANIVAQWTGIPIEKVSADETERLIKMEEVLHGRVIGQEEAVSAIARAIRRARVGLKNPNRPIASFIFAGPTGVGKSELAKTLAGYYFGSEDAMVRAVLCAPCCVCAVLCCACCVCCVWGGRERHEQASASSMTLAALFVFSALALSSRAALDATPDTHARARTHPPKSHTTPPPTHTTNHQHHSTHTTNPSRCGSTCPSLWSATP